MATGIQVLHIEKRISIASGLNRHITRKQFVSEGGVRTVEVWVPDNADPNRTAGNVELISRERVDSEGRKFELTLQQAVDLRIHEAGVKPRKGQSTCLEIIFSGSRDVMTAMSRKELLHWANDTLSWAQETWGKDNVVSASLHVDEMTPHIHMVVVPIVTGQSRRTKHHNQQNSSSRTYNIDHNKLRLCVNEVYTQGKLYEYHDSYAEKVSMKYDLSRGVKAEPGSKKKHTNSIEYNRMLAAQAAEQKDLIASIQSDYTDKKNDLSVLQGTIKDQEDIIEKNISILERQKSVYNSQRQQIAENKSIIKEQEGKISSMSQIALESTKTEIKALLSKLETLKGQKVQLEQVLIHRNAEYEAQKASMKQLTKQLQAQANLDKIPKKGILGYKTEDVDSFIMSVDIATLKQEMNKILPDMSHVNSRYYNEVIRLQKIEKEYNSLKNSPELLQGRLEELQDEVNKKFVQATIEYVLKEKITSVISCTITKTPKGNDIFATFKKLNQPTVYAAQITPSENFYLTDDPRVTSLQKAHELSGERIWWDKGCISKILQQRELERGVKAAEESINRRSNKTWEPVKTEEDSKEPEENMEDKDISLGIAENIASVFLGMLGNSGNESNSPDLRRKKKYNKRR